MNCTVDQRQAVERAAESIQNCDDTVQVDVIAPGESDHGSWTIDAFVAGPGVASDILAELALEGLTLHPQPPQGQYEIVVATA